jgi:AmmeMemoRadiSam system protein A
VTNDEDRRRLLRLAREAILQGTGLVSEAAQAPSPTGAAFVTLHKNGELRGCIGHLGTDQSLSDVVPRCALAASREDPRFPPVSPSEVSALHIEISLLGPLEPISGPAEIDLGRHGLVVEEGWHRGLLLPQVAIEWKWDAETFLAQTCRKAGLHLEAWRHGAKIFRFEAEVFAEEPQE